MTKKWTRAQQIQFIGDVLLPSLDITTDRFDWKSYVDSELTVSESWERIKSEFNISLQESFDPDYAEMIIAIV